MEHGFADRMNGQIEISVTSKDKNVCILYRDNGQGVKDIDSKRIFEAFYTDKRGQGHTGLGLFTVYNIVKSLEGDIVLIDKVDQGAEFEIIIPFDMKKE